MSKTIYHPLPRHINAFITREQVAQFNKDHPDAPLVWDANRMGYTINANNQAALWVAQRDSRLLEAVEAKL